MTKCMGTLGFTGDETLTMKECRKMFKRKSIAMLPEKHPTVPNAHSRFEEINIAFIEVRKGRVLKKYGKSILGNYTIANNFEPFPPIDLLLYNLMSRLIVFLV